MAEGKEEEIKEEGRGIGKEGKRKGAKDGKNDGGEG